MASDTSGLVFQVGSVEESSYGFRTAEAKKEKRVDWATLDRLLLWARGKKKI